MPRLKSQSQWWQNLLLDNREVILAHSAKRTNPIIRNILKRCSRLYAAVRVSNFGVVDVTTNVTNVLFHNLVLSFKASHTGGTPR